MLGEFLKNMGYCLKICKSEARFKMNYLTLDEVKKTELNILIRFDEFCIKERLYYTLAGGTLLGAIRHKGFIPWDDDIDVMMPREDYNRLIDRIKTKKICEDLDFLIPGEKDYFYPFAKICNNKTVAEMDDNTSKHGIWIDVFPMDNLPEDRVLLNHLFKKTRFWRAVVISMTTKLSGESSKKKKIAKLALKICAEIYGKENVIKKSNQVAQTYNNTSCKYIGGALWGYGPGERLKKESYLTPCRVEFEQHEFNAPQCWKEYLTGLYGDYMELPPVEKRQTHHLKAWTIDNI